MKEQIFMNSLDNKFPIICKHIFLDKITREHLLYLKEKCESREQEIMTCRPIRKRSDEESLELYDKLLKNENNLLLGIYKYDGNNSKEIIGRVSLYDYNARNRSVELGYIIEPKCEGRGYVKTAVEETCRLLFESGSVNKIYAQTASFNMSSINLLLRIGFSIDARLREHHEYHGKLYDDYIFSLLASD
ncbi:MAG TPA: GNAT family N-acetyltransferase [Candidatus Scybalomonas excrementigallinarum]|nr:GNAT family N-acetyltransferase [Candidatus Scybalomonas excrementigallinarum]